jgi:glycosyltransferase involved in cell wall biosynthesis
MHELKINILSYVPSRFKCLTSRGEGGGGWVRFRKVLEMSNNKNIKYHLVTFKPLQNPLTFGIPRTLVSLIPTLARASRMVKLWNIYLILCPIESSWMIIFGYLSSKITNRKFVVFLNSVPYFGLADAPVFKVESMKISYTVLLKNIQKTSKSRVRTLLGAFLWYVAFRMLRSSSTHIICLSSVLADELSKLDMKKRVISIYPGNGIDSDTISSVQLGIAKYDAIYAAGSLLPQKGIFDVIKIWDAVVKDQPTAKLAIAGRVDPEHLYLIEELNCLISNLGLSQNVTVICDPKKGMSQEALWEEMKCAKIFLYPSRKDTWSLIIGEALACGLPVIAYDLLGIHYAYGACPAVCLQNIGDVNGMAQTAIGLLSDDSLLRNLSYKARQYAENHSWTHVVELERKAYLAILARAR